jgi:hypothetical protein
VPDHEGNETADQLAKTGSEHPFIGLNQLAASQLELPRNRSGTGRTEITKNLGISKWTQTGKGTYTSAICQKNEGSVEVKQRPIKMGARTIYRALT